LDSAVDLLNVLITNNATQCTGFFVFLSFVNRVPVMAECCHSVLHGVSTCQIWALFCV